jgi:hypothetical protein
MGEYDPQNVGNVTRGRDVRRARHSAAPHTGECQHPVNKIYYWILGYLFITLLLPSTTFAADDLGRLFTTPEQRQTLEKLRNQKPSEVVKIPDIIFDEEPEVQEEKPVIGGITVNGLVYRKGGKSTAWINSANTFEGNFGNQYIQIDAENIRPEDVEIAIPINEKNVKLKTGQTYDPEADQIISPGYQDN